MVEFSLFIQRIISDYQKSASLVNEDMNLSTLFFVCCTKEFKPNLRLHAIVNNLSGAGKTALVESVLTPFRHVSTKDVISIVRFTGAAIERAGSFDGKILSLSQAIGQEPASIRPMLSEGRQGLLSVERKENGKFETTLTEFEGMPVFLSTSTDQALDPELLRRCILRTVDETKAQTRAIENSQAYNDSHLKIPTIKNFLFIERIIAKLQAARLGSTVDDVIIPYADKIIEKLPDTLEMRSNYPKFSKLLKSICMVKSACYRGFYKVEIKPDPPLKSSSQKIALAMYEDFTDAFLCAGKSFFQPLPAAQTMLLDHLGSQLENNGLSEGYRKVRTKEVMRALNFSQSQVWHTSTALAEKGLISLEKIEESGRKYSEIQFLKQCLEITGFDVADFDVKQWLDANCQSYSKIEVEDALEL